MRDSHPLTDIGFKVLTNVHARLEEIDRGRTRIFLDQEPSIKPEQFLGVYMETWKRICIEDYTITAENKDTLTLKRGREYFTSGIGASLKDGEPTVTVFSRYWVPVPARLFAGEILFTSESKPKLTPELKILNELMEKIDSANYDIQDIYNWCAKKREDLNG